MKRLSILLVITGFVITVGAGTASSRDISKELPKVKIEMLYHAQDVTTPVVLNMASIELAPVQIVGEVAQYNHESALSAFVMFRQTDHDVGWCILKHDSFKIHTSIEKTSSDLSGRHNTLSVKPDNANTLATCIHVMRC